MNMSKKTHGSHRGFPLEVDLCSASAGAPEGSRWKLDKGTEPKGWGLFQ